MYCYDNFPRRIEFEKERLLSDGTLSTAPRLGWVCLITDEGKEYDSRAYGHLKTTPRAVYSARTGTVISIPGRAEPLLVQDIMREPKTIEVTIGIVDERIAEDVLHAFCRPGKLLISTHPNLYYKVTVMEQAASEPLSRHFSEVTITYTASAYRYRLDEPVYKLTDLAENGTLATGTYEFAETYPHSAEVSEPQIYFATQQDALADTIAAEFTVDGGSSFICRNLAPGTVYCIDSERLSMYIYGTIDADGNVSKNAVFEDVTYKTVGSFPEIGSQKRHTIGYNGYITGFAVKPNRRWNV